MSATRPVKSVTIEFEDGEIETFQTPGGFYRTSKNNVTRDMNLENQWDQHEVRWSDRQKTHERT